MTTSGSERRAVSERLRAAAKTKSGSADYLWNRLEIAVNGWKFGDVIDESYVFDNDVLSRLADLIDPTCHVVTSGEWRGRPIGSACSVCHAPLYHSTAWAHGMRYCAQCGSRVVDDVDRDGE